MASSPSEPIHSFEKGSAGEVPQRNTKLSVPEELTDRFNEAFGPVTGDQEKQAWLRHLHANYTERFMKDNDRIWSTGSIFIPLSLAGLAALPDLTWLTAIPIALASITLIVSWHFFAENHRAFQNYSLEVVKAIERQIGVNIDGGKFKASSTAKLMRVQTVRQVVCWIVAVLWIIAVAILFQKEQSVALGDKPVILKVE